VQVEISLVSEKSLMARKASNQDPSRFEKLVDLMKAAYVEVELLPTNNDPFALICWFVVGRRSKHRGRERAFEALRRAKGLTPGGLLSVTPEKLKQVCSQAGPYDDERAEELLHLADAVEEKCGADFAATLKKNKGPAFVKLLTEEMSLARDVADFARLFILAEVAWPLTPRARRILTRLGYRPETAASNGDPLQARNCAYDSIIAQVSAEWIDDPEWLKSAYILFQKHGEDVCYTANPACDRCVLKTECAYFAERSSGAAPRSAESDED
jgi:endonuclease III